MDFYVITRRGEDHIRVNDICTWRFNLVKVTTSCIKRAMKIGRTWVHAFDLYFNHFLAHETRKCNYQLWWFSPFRYFLLVSVSCSHQEVVVFHYKIKHWVVIVPCLKLKTKTIRIPETFLENSRWFWIHATIHAYHNSTIIFFSYHDCSVNRYRVDIMTHQNLRLEKCWKLFRAFFVIFPLLLGIRAFSFVLLLFTLNHDYSVCWFIFFLEYLCSPLYKPSWVPWASLPCDLAMLYWNIFINGKK